MRALLASLLAALLSAPPLAPVGLPGRVQGTVSVNGRPLSGVGLALVDLESGAVQRTQSAAGGGYELRLPAGRYVLAADGVPGLGLARGPALLTVASGANVRADVDLVLVPVGAGSETPPADALTVRMDPVACLIEGQYPLIKATIQPAERATAQRVYFKSALASGFFYVEMQPLENDAGLPEPGRFVGKLPAPKRQASPITLFVQAQTANGAPAKSPEVSAQVVSTEAECSGIVAATGPGGGIQVYSAATGTAVTPAGFAASGVAVTAGALGLLLSGAAAVGLTATVTVFSSPSPPTPRPPESPSPPPPTPRPPRPSPSPSPSPVEPPDPACP